MPRENQLPRIPDPFADSPDRQTERTFFRFLSSLCFCLSRTELSSLSSTEVHYGLIINVFDIVIYRNVICYADLIYTMHNVSTLSVRVALISDERICMYSAGYPLNIKAIFTFVADKILYNIYIYIILHIISSNVFFNPEEISE